MLVRVGPNRPWLLNYYQKVPHPRTLACVEELLHYGFVPLITDFNMIIKHNDIVGMDFTFFRNGYKYHTRFDDAASVTIESIQHVGDNLLTLIRELANAPELKPLAQTVDNVVFYDVFELFVIHCTATHVGLIHCTVFVLSIALALRSFHNFGLRLCRQSSIYLGLMSSAITVGWFAAAIFIAIEALLIDAFEYNLSWYNNRLIIFGLYVIPTNICIFSVTLIFNYFNDKNLFTIGARTQIQLHLLRLIWTIVLIIGTFVHFRFMYVILIPIIFQMFTFGLIELFSVSHTMKKWLIIYVLGMVLPTMFLMQHALQIIIIFISVYGRSGPDKNSEVHMGILVVVLTILTISYYMPLITLVRKPMALVMTLTLMFVIYIIILMTPFGFPYSGNPESPAPQRYYIYHMKRIFRNDSNEIFKNDSGFYLLNSDRNSPNNLKKYVTELSDTKSLSEDCDRSLFCGLPIVNTKIIPILRDSTWIPTEEPKIPEPISLQLISKTYLSDNFIRYNFTLSGPNHVGVYISPKSKINIYDISLLPKTHLEVIFWNGRPTYVILYSWLKSRSSLNFYIDFETPSNWTNLTFDVALTARYINDKTFVKIPKFSQFLEEFPKWTDVVTALATFESWVY